MQISLEEYTARSKRKNEIKVLLGNRATDDFLNWLEQIGYYTCPAAKSHHGNTCGGLFEHSMAVAEHLYYLTKKLGLTWDKPESPWVVGLLHDICKTDDYIYDFINDIGIDMNPEQMYPGHGSKSVIMLANRFPLTDEEKDCIMYHMGAFTDKSEWGYYSRAVHNNKNVLFTHTADMLASQVEGV